MPRMNSDDAGRFRTCVSGPVALVLSRTYSLRIMANRYADWLRQSEADLAHARMARDAGSYEWSCFAAHQAAEKALKSLFLRLGMEAWGHTLTALIGNLPESVAADDALGNGARVLDKHYIPTRYPNGFDTGAPTDFYTRDEADTAIARAEEIVGFCRRQIDRAADNRPPG